MSAPVAASADPKHLGQKAPYHRDGAPPSEGLTLSVADVARRWQATGVSVVPIKANGTKQPAVQWAPYQAVAPTLAQIDQWWSNGQQYGLALICGAVSGNLEMLELEGRATGNTSLSIIEETIKGTEVEDTWRLLTGPQGYMEWTPSGGIHLLYRISDHPVPGNTKVARTRDRKVLAETRGEGGYVVVAPTSGLCHPSGESWELLSGDFGSLPVITWDERTLLHEAIRMCLDEETEHEVLPVRPPTLPSPPARLSVGGSSPGDEFEATTDWAEILEPHGWTLHSRKGIERNWTRDGKNPRDGISATTGYKGDRDRLFVFSTSTIFDTEVPYTKFGAYTVLNHGGDYKAAASALARQGFGSRPQLGELVLAQRDVEEATPEDPRYPANDSGNARYLHDKVRGQYHWVSELKDWLRWDGRVWRLDRHQTLSLAFQELVEEKRLAAVAETDDQAVRRWTKAGDQPRISAAMRVMQSQPDVSLGAEQLDPNRNMVNVLNGVLDLRSGELHPHDSKYLMTKIMNASYRPGAQCPNFESFMERVLPDQSMRTYVQRALGYTLLGDADQRAMFLIYGPSGTGKSTLMETMSEVFGEYGVTAPTGTFRARNVEQGPTNDLHALMGRRFVSTSETNEGTLYNEDLLKRLTGRDKVTSRELYQQNQEWVPVCTLWLATNHLPRFSTDDDAIWRRLKLVPFTTVLVDEPDHEDDFSRTRLVPEKDGILNWLLQGLRDFLAYGLGEPPEVKEAAQGQRLQSDPVSQFLEDRLEEGVLIRAEGYTMKLTELYSMYVEWARQVGERAVGSRRFNQRLANGSSGLLMAKQGQQMFWQGLGRAAASSLLGTMITSGWGPPDPG